MRLHRVKYTELQYSNHSVYEHRVCNFAATRLLFDDPPILSTLAFRNGLEYRNLDFSRLTGIRFFTLCGHLVRFGLVNTEFKNAYVELRSFYWDYFSYVR